MKEGRICEELTGEEMAKLSASQMRSRRLRPLNLNTIQIEKIEPIGHSEVFLQIKNMSFSHKAMPELLHLSLIHISFLPGLKTRPVKLSTNLTSRAAKGLRPPKRTFPRSKKKSRSTRPQPNSLKNKRRSRRQDRPDRPQTVFRSR